MTNFIDGNWIQGEGSDFESINPANSMLIWSGISASGSQINLAVKAARSAFKTWSQRSFEERSNFISRFVQILQNQSNNLAKKLSQDTGKVIWEAENEINLMINKFEISVQAYTERCKDKIQAFTTFTSHTRYKPIGVVAILGPYNFPGHVPNGHIIPALLAGNTIILKPSELTPMISEAIIKAWEEARLPNGVINLVQGKSETAIELCAHPEIDGIFFTGSSKTGQIIHSNLGGNIQKILALELGGNNPLILHDAQDIDAAAYLILQSAFLTAGQRCTCARRLIIVKNSQTKKILDKFIEISSNLQIGDPLDPNNFMGPVISTNQAKSLLEAQDFAISKGAFSLLKMQGLSSLGEAFVSPGILDCSEASKIEDKEFFGPLLQVYMASDLDQAIQISNNSAYGLSAGLISNSKDIFTKYWQETRAGLINWNNQLTGATSIAPFGGLGLSGNYRPSGYHAADYCSYPIASLETQELQLPEKRHPGIKI